MVDLSGSPGNFLSLADDPLKLSTRDLTAPQLQSAKSGGLLETWPWKQARVAQSGPGGLPQPGSWEQPGSMQHFPQKACKSSVQPRNGALPSAWLVLFPAPSRPSPPSAATGKALSSTAQLTQVTGHCQQLKHRANATPRASSPRVSWREDKSHGLW